MSYLIGLWVLGGAGGRQGIVRAIDESRGVAFVEVYSWVDGCGGQIEPFSVAELLDVTSGWRLFNNEGVFRHYADRVAAGKDGAV